MDVAISAVAGPGNQHRRTHDVIDIGDIDLYLGLDIGNGEHHATAVTTAGKKAFDTQRAAQRPAAPETTQRSFTGHPLVRPQLPSSSGALSNYSRAVAHGPKKPSATNSPTSAWRSVAMAERRSQLFINAQ
ncbi:hypothetical protein [Streptomyces boluensis]|uniref:Uncharacterized protein n=1 Tax=Streptomyces boluensis TaxID=1775135 RepID=A0A964UQC4_9ACTN|nr:hypothetical protein [Streptomyces boluensis]NBE52561.1 hypothetical protein [Streptomyces boluensis]